MFLVSLIECVRMIYKNSCHNLLRQFGITSMYECKEADVVDDVMMTSGQSYK